MAEKEIPAKLLRVGISPMLQHRLLAILDQIHAIVSERALVGRSHDDAGPFLQPVDPDALGIPHYRDIIRHPMDLGTVQRRLEDGEYDKLVDFASDVRLIWRNCLTFNQDENSAPLRRMAKTLGALFEALLEDVVEEVQPGSLAKAGLGSRSGREVARYRSRRKRKRVAPKVASVAENSDEDNEDDASAEEDVAEMSDEDDEDGGNGSGDDEGDEEGSVPGRRSGPAGRAARRAHRQHQHHQQQQQYLGEETGLLFQPDFVIADPEVASAVAHLEIRDVFWKELQQVLRRKKMASAQRKPPILSDEPLDLWLVWNFVQLWGGYDAMCKEANKGSWLEVFRQLPNNDGSEHDGAAQLRKCYERYLLPYERTYHSDLGKRVAEGIDPRVALRGVTVASFPAASVVAPVTRESARPHWGSFSVCVASGTVVSPPAKRRALACGGTDQSVTETHDDTSVCTCHACGRTVCARNAALMGYLPLEAVVKARHARQTVADKWADEFVNAAWRSSSMATVPQAPAQAPPSVQPRKVPEAVPAEEHHTTEKAETEAAPAEASAGATAPLMSAAEDDDESESEGEEGIARSRPRRERKRVVPFGCLQQDFGLRYRHSSGRGKASTARPRLAHETVPAEPSRESESDRLAREAEEDQADMEEVRANWFATTTSSGADVKEEGNSHSGDDRAWTEAWKGAVAASRALERSSSLGTASAGPWVCGACVDRPQELTRVRRYLRRDVRWIQEQPVPMSLVAR